MDLSISSVRVANWCYHSVLVSDSINQERRLNIRMEQIHRSRCSMVVMQEGGNFSLIMCAPEWFSFWLKLTQWETDYNEASGKVIHLFLQRILVVRKMWTPKGTLIIMWINNGHIRIIRYLIIWNVTTLTSDRKWEVVLYSQAQKYQLHLAQHVQIPL